MSVVGAREQRHYERMREKVEQWCKDYWRPYHGSCAHREDSDGNQMVEKKKAGGHMPLNAAVMETWKEGKLQGSRRLFGRVLAELGLSDPQAFAEIHDLFGRYGAGDSDYDFLKAGALEDRDSSRSAGRSQDRCDVRRYLRFLTVERGIDSMTAALISWGITDKDFWADFGLNAVPTKRGTGAEEKKRERYLVFEKHCEQLRQEGHKRYRNKALKEAADECGVDKRTVERAVQDFESGYLDAS